MKAPTFIALLFSIFWFGCAAPREVLYDQSVRSPTTSIEVFQGGMKPDKQFKEIGMIAFEDFGGEETAVLQKMIERAKKLGANALILQPRQDTGYSFNLFSRSGNKYMYKALAVVYE